MLNFTSFLSILEEKESQTDSLKSKFLQKVDKSGGHWLWKGHTSKVTKQPQVWFKGKVHPANRVAWLLFKGKSPTPGRIIRHTCGKKDCVNPAHLEISKNTKILSLDSEK
jgi:hypothetical protein